MLILGYNSTWRVSRRPTFTAASRLARFVASHAANDEQNSLFSADIFTSCLTTPIQMSLLWYIVKTNSKSTYSLDLINDIPGVLSDRRTMLGELNWIFTAITDTIAWNALPTEAFQRLFRQASRPKTLNSKIAVSPLLGSSHSVAVSQLPPRRANYGRE